MHFHTNSTQISAFYLFAVWWHLCIMCTKLCRQSTSVCCTKGQLKLQYIVTAWFSQYDHYIIINTAITNETCAKFANQWSTVSSSLSCNICSREMRHGVQSLFFFTLANIKFCSSNWTTAWSCCQTLFHQVEFVSGTDLLEPKASSVALLNNGLWWTKLASLETLPRVTLAIDKHDNPSIITNCNEWAKRGWHRALIDNPLSVNPFTSFHNLGSSK